MRFAAVALVLPLLLLAVNVSAQEPPGAAPGSGPGDPQQPVEIAPPPQEPPPQLQQQQVPPPPPVGVPGQQPAYYYYAPPPPPRLIGYARQRRWSLFAIGAGVFGSTWLGNVANALTSGEYLGIIPLVGPWLSLSHDNGVGTNVLIGLDGAAQAAGATLMILGVSLTKKVPIYAVVPTRSGFAVAGRF